jgi:hypothetical protein
MQYNTVKTEDKLWELYKQTQGASFYGEEERKAEPIKFQFFGSEVTLTVQKPDYRERSRKSRAYVFVRNESLWDNLMDRRNRPTKIYKMILEMALSKAGIEKEEYKSAYWSQHAGCTCACSPGFILNGIRNFTFHISVEDKEELRKEVSDAPEIEVFPITEQEKASMKRTVLNV